MYNTLISPQDLARLMQGATPPVVLDVSFDLADPAAGPAAYAAGHLPGAQYAHLENALSGKKTGHNGRHPLPSREAFAATAGKLGITPSTQVVVYDRQGAMFCVRAWWMLKWIGHDAVAVLDGGLQAWQAEGGAVTREPASVQVAPPYPLGESLVGAVDANQLAARLNQPGLPLIDARAPERYRGETEPLDPVAGHIPGALNRFFKHNLADDGRFKTAEQLRTEYEALLGGCSPGEVVHQCGSGVTACHNMLAMEVAGLAGSRLYPGSWSEWCTDPARPVAKG